MSKPRLKRVHPAQTDTSSSPRLSKSARGCAAWRGAALMRCLMRCSSCCRICSACAAVQCSAWGNMVRRPARATCGQCKYELLTVCSTRVPLVEQGWVTSAPAVIVSPCGHTCPPSQVSSQATASTCSISSLPFSSETGHWRPTL